MRKRVGVPLLAVTLMLTMLCGIFSISGRVRAAEQTTSSVSPVSLPILMYHHISKSPSQWGKHVISPETFEGDLKYLSDQGYTTIGIEDLLAYVDQGKALPQKPVMITFDDGQLSFLEYAMPLLEKYDMRAMVAIVGSFADLYTKTPDRHVSYAHMNWEDLTKLSQTGRVDVESHTYDMHNLKGGRKGCRINWKEDPIHYKTAFLSDLQKNQKLITDATGIRPLAFIYPYGYFCDEAKKVLAQQGYRLAFTCTEQVNHLTGDPAELMDLCRFNRPNNVDRTTFFAQFH